MRRISTATKVVDKFGAGKHGFTDGDAVGGIPSTDLEAQLFDHIQEELCAIIESIGGVVDGSSRNQVLTAIKIMIDAQAGNYCIDTGAANAYVVALDPPILAYTDGMTIRFRASNANTGASTLNGGAGAVPLRNDVDGALAAGDLPAGVIVTATYVAALGHFLINSLVPSQALTQTQADARYAALAGLATQLFSVADATGAHHALALGQFLGTVSTSGYLEIPAMVAGVKRVYILQWTDVGLSTTPTNFTLPISFTTAFLKVVGSCTNSAQSIAAQANGLSQVTAFSAAGTPGAQIFAIGY
jgi:hypothetical protein